MMTTRLASKTVLGALLVLFATLALAQPAAALNADYWRGGWRTPLGDEPHIYYFVIRGNQVTGAYCRSCSDATTMGFIDGTWDEKAGIAFTVTFANSDGRIRSVDNQQAMLVEGRLTVTGGRRQHTEWEGAHARQRPAQARPWWGACVLPPTGHPSGAARGPPHRRRGWRWRRTTRTVPAIGTIQGAAAGGRRWHLDRCLVRPLGYEQTDLHVSPRRRPAEGSSVRPV